jgi:ankyrin repeat protein
MRSAVVRISLLFVSFQLTDGPATAEDTRPGPPSLVVAAAAPHVDAGPVRPHSLHWAAIQNHVSVGTRLIDRGAIVDVRDADGRTPLMMATAFGNLEVAEALLAKGADPLARDRIRGDTPIHFAARVGKSPLVALLLARGVGVDIRASAKGETPLHYAAMFGHRKTIEMLVAGGADPNVADQDGVTPLQYASKRRRASIVELLRGLGAREGGLQEAANADDVGRVYELLAEGADIDAPGLGGTSLHVAAAKGHLAVVRILLDAGADIEAVAEPNGARPLHAAAMNDYASVARFLIERGASVEARDNEGRTPLLVAARFGNAGAAAALLSGGADPLSEDGIYGGGPIHYAALAGDIEVATLLLSRGLDINARSSHDGWAPLHFAAKHGHRDMIQFLIENGADINLEDDLGATPLHYAHHAGWAAGDVLRSLGARE